MTADQLLDSMTDHALAKAKKDAWYEAANAWQEYRDALVTGEPLAVTNVLHDEAWSAEWWWRSLHDAQQKRLSQA